MQSKVTRRNFVAGATAGMASIFAAGMTMAHAQVPEEWDLEADVVIVGFGGAGATAAIQAAEDGAEVIILEKADYDNAGGNTSCCGGGGILANPEDKQTAFDFIKLQMPSTITDEEIMAFVEESCDEPEWLEAHGFDGTITTGRDSGGAMYAHMPSAIGWNSMVSGNGGGFGLFKWERGIVESMDNIDVEYETPAKQLIFDPETKEVFGVLAEYDGEPVTVKARRAVIMTCGGFENNKQMLNAFYPPETPIYPCGSPFNTGDGVAMIVEIGAALRGFGSAEWGCHCCVPASEELGVGACMSWSNTEVWNNAIAVNVEGKRFMNESCPTCECMPNFRRPLHDKRQMPELVFSMETLSYTNLPMFFICDQTRADQGAFFDAAAASSPNHWCAKHDVYYWSDDNQAEVEKGWVKKADTLEELAEMLGIDAAGLVASVEAYNAGVAGDNDEFGRTMAHTPIETAPFYGTEMGLGLINTQGGAARNEKHQVLNYAGQPIPRLYSAGEFGSMYVWMYQGAGNVTETLLGRYAGKHAAEEEPWC